MKRSSSAPFALGLFLLGLAGCGPDPSAGDDPLAAMANDPSSHLASWASHVRELDFARRVAFDHITPEEYQKQVAENAEEADDADLRELAETYGRLGFFDVDLDVESTLAGSGAWAVAYYSPRTKRVTVIGEPDDDVMVHELTHVLQDQNFDLQAYDDYTTSDTGIARRAVVEGDADLAQGRFILNTQYQVDLDRANWSEYVPALLGGTDDMLAQAQYPVFFLDYPAFVYTYGQIYCAHNLLGVTPEAPAPAWAGPYDWRREDELFEARPPVSAGQVVTLDARGGGADVGLDDVPAKLATAFERIDWDTLGAWYSYLLFYPVKDAAGTGDIRGVATAWRGDRALFLRDLATKATSVVWASRWDGADPAARVASALGAIHGVTFDAAEPRLGTAADGEVVWIERAGDAVVLVKNVDAERAAALAAAALAEPAAKRAIAPRARPPLARRLRRRELGWGHRGG